MSCMLVVAFVCLLPVPALRGPVVLPGLLGAWFISFGLTMLLQVGLAAWAHGCLDLGMYVSQA